VLGAFSSPQARGVSLLPPGPLTAHRLHFLDLGDLRDPRLSPLDFCVENSLSSGR